MGTKKIAIQTQLWGNGNLEQNFKPIFDEVIQAGYDGVECRFAVLRQKEELKRYLKDRALKIHALHTSPDTFNSENGIKEEFRELLSDMAEFGITNLLISPSRKSSFDEQVASLDAAARMAEICRRVGVQLHYHNHDFEFEHGFRLYDEIVKVPHLGIALDIGWLYRARVPLAEFMERYRSSITYYHVKDTTFEEWRELGTGDVNMKEAVRLLESVPMEWWTIEQDNSRLAALQSAQASRSFLRTIVY